MNDVSSLIAFYYVAELGSITRAAKVLNISQAAMSKRVRKAESECGVALVDRSSSGGVRITCEGQIIKQCVENMLLQYTNMIRDLKGIPRIITVSYASELFVGDLVVLISRFKLDYPDVSFNVVHATKEIAIRMLRDGTATHALIPCNSSGDIGVKYTDIGPSLLMTHRIGVMFPKYVPLANRPYITADMLKYYSAIIPSDRHLMKEFMKWLGPDNDLMSPIRMHSLGGTLLAVREGIGYAVMPMTKSACSTPGMRLCPLSPSIRISAAIITGTQNPRNESVILFDRFLKEYCKNL